VTVAGLLIAVSALACDFSRPRSQIVTGPDGLRTFTWFTEMPGGGPLLCTAAAAVDPVHGTFEGEAGAREPVWLRDDDGRQLSVVWPAGFSARFEPLAALYNEHGVVVVRERQEVRLGQVSRGGASGAYDNPYLASGIVFDGCYPYSSGT
jgi:hypothetical protein